MEPATPPAARAQIAPGRLALIALIGVATFINYIDRGNLATAAPLIKRDLHLTALDIGLLTSAFFWTYVPAQLAAGWFVDRVGGYWALGAGFALWSLATALTGLAGGFATLLGLRVLLGLAEAAAFPGMSKLYAEAVPAENLGLANAAAIMGTSLGPAFGTLAGGYILAAFGWRPMFVLFGLAALLWLVPWLRLARRPPAPLHRDVAPTPPSFRDVLSRRGLWACTLGHFSVVYGLYFVLAWLPLWLVKQQGYSLLGMAKLGAAVYLASALATLAFGWGADRLIARGASLNLVRKAVSVLGHLVGALGLAGCALGHGTAVVASLFVAGVGLGVVAIWPITQTLSGPRAAGRWVGIQNCLANTAGLIGPIVTGWIVDRTGSFDAAFLLAAAMVLLGAFAWSVMLGRVEPVAWDELRGRLVFSS